MIEPSSVVDARALELSHDAVALEQVVAGSPSVAASVLAALPNGTELGVWELSPGTMRDVEVDETFIVIAGAATVRFLDDGRELVLAPGSVGRLSAGDRTEWTVTETLRKIYVV